MSTEPTPGPHAGMYPTINRKPRRWPWIASIVAALVLGYGAGAASDDTEPVADAEPEPAVTVTPESEVVTETVVETETLEVTPQACLDALDEASTDVILEWNGELTDILDRDGYLVVAEWNDLDAEYAPRLDEPLSVIDGISISAQECRNLAEG